MAKGKDEKKEEVPKEEPKEENEPAPEPKETGPKPDKDGMIVVYPLVTIGIDKGDPKWPRLKAMKELWAYDHRNFDPSNPPRIPFKLAQEFYKDNKVVFTQDELRDFRANPRAFRMGYRRVRRDEPEWVRPE